MCRVTHRYVRLTRGPCSPDTVRCAYSNCAGPSMTRRSPWSSVIEEGTITRRATTHLELHRIAQAHTNYELGRTRARHRGAKGFLILNWRTGLGSLQCDSDSDSDSACDGGVVVVVVVLTVKLMTCLWRYVITDAPNYGGRALWTPPGPAPVCRALRKRHPISSLSINFSTSARLSPPRRHP